MTDIVLKYTRYDLPSTSNDDGLTTMDHSLISASLYELRRARIKFPESRCNTVALMEEVGELAKAQLHYAAGKGSKARIREEALQVIAMAIRIVNEGDPSIIENHTHEPD